MRISDWSSDVCSSDLSTMLIHTSVLNSVHLATRAAVEPYLRNLARRLDDGDENLFREMEKIWSDESETVDADQFGNEKVSFDRLRPLLSVVASSIDVKDRKSVV